MSAQNLELDPLTGDYVIENGRPVQDGSLNTPAYIRLKTSRTRWLYAPDTKFGSDFYLFHRRHLQNDDKTLITVAQRALQPLIDDGRAAAIRVTQLGSDRNAWQCRAQITQANGETTPLIFRPVN